MGAEKDLRVQVQTVSHDPEDPQTELFATQEKGRLDFLEVAQGT